MPGPDHRVTKKEFLGWGADLLARFAMGLVDDNRRGTRFCPSPTRAATIFANCVGAAEHDPLGEQYSSGFGQGWMVKDLFAAARERLEPAVAELAGAVLDEYYIRISDALDAIGREKGAVSPEEIQSTVAYVLVRDFTDEDGSPVGLWLEFALKHYPESGYVRLALQGSPRLRPIADAFSGAEVKGAW